MLCGKGERFMGKGYKILYREGSAEIVEKKSRFIANVFPVESEEEAVACLESMRKKYWDARHHCSAFVLGEKGEITRCSDDGEPSGTAGRPILDVLLGEEVRNACIVVTRFFGGTLLGTGGLVRAYSKAAREGLAAAVIWEKQRGRKISFFCEFYNLGYNQYIAESLGLESIGSQYTDTVMLSYMVPEDQEELVEVRITEGTAGRVRIEKGDMVYYAVGQA